MGRADPPLPPAPEDRDRSAADRDRAAERRDLAAAERDQHAGQRDERADGRDEAAGRIDVDASADRSGASRDRRASAGDREQAQADREASRSDRDRAAHDRADGILDELTGAYRRRPGMHELRRQIIEARRREVPFVLAFADVDGLKATNDAGGHDAGDELLRQVAHRLREVVRAYDVLVRYGGDEFLCGLVDATLAEATKRFDRVNERLAEHEGASITVGIAELSAGESLRDVITRADALMYRERGTPLH